MHPIVRARPADGADTCGGPSPPRRPTVRGVPRPPATGSRHVDRPATDPAWAEASLPARVRAARGDPAVGVLEGVHALKHALRFDADVEVVLTPARPELARLLDELAADVAHRALARTVEVGPGAWAQLAPRGLPSPALSLARRPATDPATVLADPRPAPVVLLEGPTHLGNVGAAVRVAAAADAAGVLTTGPADPWSPAAIRGAAGLQFALPTARIGALPAGDRPVVAVDPAGRDLGAVGLPPRAVLAFGTERGGLSAALRDRAGLHVRIPMRAGVSSLNLATAVAVVLYAWEGGRRGE